MKRRTRWPLAAINSIVVCAAISSAWASPVVTSMPDESAASAAALVGSLLGSGGNLSVVAGSPQYSGAASASGTFSNGGTTAGGLGIANGVVLTTGDARFIGSSASFAGDNPNKSGDFTAGVLNSLTPNTAGGHPLLDTLTPAGTTNASVLSFDFVPSAGLMKLSLVFGSEDYNDLVNTGFPTDVFGVFVNGVNQALVPGSGLSISASGVNCGGPTSGPAPGFGPNCSLYRDNVPFFDAIDSELDGMTFEITLSMAVNAGEVNTISIGIADALDDVGDSAVMLRAGSLLVPEPASLGLLLAGLVCAGFASRGRKGSRAA